jgi:hypothetical protein
MTSPGNWLVAGFLPHPYPELAAQPEDANNELFTPAIPDISRPVTLTFAAAGRPHIPRGGIDRHIGSHYPVGISPKRFPPRCPATRLAKEQDFTFAQKASGSECKTYSGRKAPGLQPAMCL